MEIKITTLSENTAGAGYLGEWGISMFIEADGRKILFDTGAGLAAVHNAGLMGVDLADAECIVLSHGHYDHTGGLQEVLARMGKKVDIYAHPDVWAQKYSGTGSGGERYIGIPFEREELEAMGASFQLSAGPVKLSENIITTGEVPMTNDYEVMEGVFWVEEDGELKPDALNDDMGMVINTDYGLVVILGCAHHGIVNTLEHARKITGQDLIYAAIGGTHLVHASRERIEKTAVALQEMGLQYLGASHCTGPEASAYLAQVFGERFFQNNAGTRLTLPF